MKEDGIYKMFKCTVIWNKKVKSLENRSNSLKKDFVGEELFQWNFIIGKKIKAQNLFVLDNFLRLFDMMYSIIMRHI